MYWWHADSNKLRLKFTFSVEQFICGCECLGGKNATYVLMTKTAYDFFSNDDKKTAWIFLIAFHSFMSPAMAVLSKLEIEKYVHRMHTVKYVV